MSDASFKKAKILIVDDDADVRTIARMTLQKAGYTAVSETESPMIGLNKLQWGNVDLAILDWQMPQLKGIDILRTIRQQNTEMPIIMLTAEDRLENVKNAMQAGVTDYIVKPWSSATLLAKVEAALKKLKQFSEGV